VCVVYCLKHKGCIITVIKRGYLYFSQSNDYSNTGSEVTTEEDSHSHNEDGSHSHDDEKNHEDVEIGDVMEKKEDAVGSAAGTQLAGTPLATSTADGRPLIGGDAVAGEVTPGEASFTVLGRNFEYDIKEMRVKEGDTVTITFRSNGGTHDWVVDEFNAATEQVSTDGETTVTFVADKKGTFEYYCSVGSHREQGMVGNLIVE